MAVADRPSHIDVRIGRTLARPARRRRPYRAAIKAAAQVGLVVVAVVAVMEQGSGSVAHTLFFGTAALIYLMADFVMELPSPASAD